MARVVVRNLSKSYSAASTPVQSVTFEVEDRSFLTVLGPSGCGKSTLLRLVAGLETPSSGEIFIDDRPVNKLGPAERDIAMVFQSYALYPHLNVFDNIAISLRLRKIKRDEISRRVRETARQLDIEALLDRKPKALSGGQRQRVALGRAIIRNPKVFLLDEPLSNLDAILRERMRTELKALFGRLGATVMYVTHDQTEAMTLSSKIAVVSGGRLQQLDTPEAVYARPANVFVAGFLGSPRINLLKCIVDAGGLMFGTQRLELGPDASARLSDRKDVLVGIRPESIAVGFGPMDAEIELVEPLGAFTLLTLKLSNERLQALAEPRHFEPGRIKITLDERHFHYFDPQTECRI